MRIAIHAADLDHDRIDGTRVYILNMLKYFGKLKPKNSFYIYHRDEFNPKLTPPTLANYFVKKIPFKFLWTQTRFALQVFLDNPDVLWMPVANYPTLKRKKTKVVVTIHDLAFKIFPQYFLKKDLFKLNRLGDRAIKKADKIIAISEVTKKDILRFYPNVKENKIAVVHHGFDKNLFEKKINPHFAVKVLGKYNLTSKKYLLYVGAIQPRKDLITLIEAFDNLKEKNKDLKLVFAGAPAWHSEKTLGRIQASRYRKDIIVTGTIGFDSLPTLYQNALAFVFPSLYEGFGIPVLEAMTSGTPAIIAGNSSLLEVGGKAAVYFKTGNSKDLQQKIEKIIEDKDFRKLMIEKGKIHAEKFSWEKCAQNTLEEFEKW